jgi:hypothetical protein
MYELKENPRMSHSIFGARSPLNISSSLFTTSRSVITLFLISLSLLAVAYSFFSTNKEDAFKLQIARLESTVKDLEARHGKIHLDLAQNVQQVVSDQYSQINQGPLVQRNYPLVFMMPAMMRKRILITGGAGFVGSHLVDALMTQGHYVYVLDNLFTGRHRNIEHWMGHPQFQFFQHEIQPLVHLQHQSEGPSNIRVQRRFEPVRAKLTMRLRGADPDRSRSAVSTA